MHTCWSKAFYKYPSTLEYNFVKFCLHACTYTLTHPHTSFRKSECCRIILVLSTSTHTAHLKTAHPQHTCIPTCVHCCHMRIITVLKIRMTLPSPSSYPTSLPALPFFPLSLSHFSSHSVSCLLVILISSPFCPSHSSTSLGCLLWLQLAS